ncbi:MAG: PVC-type heme-binding CxxCH protein [Planctomycetaceae bacterium]
MRYRTTFLLLILATFLPLHAEEPDYSAELPSLPAKEPAEALASFTVKPPFEMQLAAAEPTVMDPVAMAFDENGRLYVAEMRDYSEQEHDYLGAIRLLEDADGDGTFEKSTVFAKELSWPTAVACWDGGVFVGAPPHLLYLKDTSGDGVADVRKTIFTGFSRDNVQAMMNSLRWGLDNRIHGAGSSIGGSILFTGDPNRKPVRLGRQDFAFDPRTFEFEATTASSQHGMSFDDWGQKFLCSNSNHIQQVMYEDELIARNPYLKAPGGAASIAADGPQGPVFRTSPVEPWRIVRTRLRVQGVVPGVVEFGGKVSGYFSSATGVTIYRGDAWPEEWHGTAIIGDVGSNLIHRKKLDTSVLPFVATRVDENSELVASADTWFRPVQFENGPDGSLYVADFYRETIEHPKSLPESIKKHLDLTSRGRGRLWRIAPKDFTPRPTPKLGDATTAELVELLSHPNAWHRATASRLIYERQDGSAVPLLKNMATASGSPLGRLHALYALDGLKALTPEQVAGAFADAHAGVRENAARLAASRLNGSPELLDPLIALTTDDDVWVRYRAAFSLGAVTTETDSQRQLTAESRNKAVAALGDLLRRDGANRWMRLAAMSSLTGHEAAVLAKLLREESFRRVDHAPTVCGELAAIVTRRNRPDEVDTVAEAIAVAPDAVPARAVVNAWLAEPSAAVRTAFGTGDLKELIVRRLADAEQTALDDDSTVPKRLAAIGTLRLAPFETAAEAFDELTTGRQPPEIQSAAVNLLRGYGDAGVAERLIEAWPRLSPSVREVVAEALTSTATMAGRLLDAIEFQEFDAAALPEARRKLLREHPTAAIGKRATKLLAGTMLSKRDDVVAGYRSALDLNGDAAEGKTHFKKHCMVCHKIGSEGHEVGPNLTAIKARGPEFILLNILDPSREVNPEFVDYALVTGEGVVKTGLIASESPTAITLKRAEGVTESVLRLDVEQLQSTGRSIMPDGLEKQLDQQAMADVIAYLMSLE